MHWACTLLMLGTGQLYSCPLGLLQYYIRSCNPHCDKLCSTPEGCENGLLDGSNKNCWYQFHKRKHIKIVFIFCYISYTNCQARRSQVIRKESTKKQRHLLYCVQLSDFIMKDGVSLFCTVNTISGDGALPGDRVSSDMILTCFLWYTQLLHGKGWLLNIDPWINYPVVFVITER